MTQITRYPLYWPPHHTRSPANSRKAARFGTKRSAAQGWGTKSLTLTEALDRLYTQLNGYNNMGKGHRVALSDMIISSNLTLNRDGTPSASSKRPEDPGVAIYFVLDKQNRCIPCDGYDRVEDNIAAIAATLEALRTIERHDAHMSATAFKGFDALPSPDHIAGRDWRDVLHCYNVNLNVVRMAYLQLRSKYHPDKPEGDVYKFNEVQKAWEQAQKELG